MEPVVFPSSFFELNEIGLFLGIQQKSRVVECHISQFLRAIKKKMPFVEDLRKQG